MNIKQKKMERFRFKWANVFSYIGCGSEAESASCYLKVAGSIPVICLLNIEPQTAPDVPVGFLRDSRNHQCVNV